MLPLALFSDIAGVAEVVVKLVLRSEPLHVLTVRDKVLRFTLSNKSFTVFFSQIFVRSPIMRDDLHNYLLPLLLQLFRIFNVCLNRVFEEFFLFIFGQVIESLELVTPFAGQLDHKPWTNSY
jgi:hypothetical protein